MFTFLPGGLQRRFTSVFQNPAASKWLSTPLADKSFSADLLDLSVRMHHIYRTVSDNPNGPVREQENESLFVPHFIHGDLVFGSIYCKAPPPIFFYAAKGDVPPMPSCRRFVVNLAQQEALEYYDFLWLVDKRVIVSVHSFQTSGAYESHMILFESADVSGSLFGKPLIHACYASNNDALHIDGFQLARNDSLINNQISSIERCYAWTDWTEQFAKFGKIDGVVSHKFLSTFDKQIIEQGSNHVIRTPLPQDSPEKEALKVSYFNCCTLGLNCSAPNLDSGLVFGKQYFCGFSGIVSANYIYLNKGKNSGTPLLLGATGKEHSNNNIIITRVEQVDDLAQQSYSDMLSVDVSLEKGKSPKSDPNDILMDIDASQLNHIPSPAHSSGTPVRFRAPSDESESPINIFTLSRKYDLTSNSASPSLSTYSPSNSVTNSENTALNRMLANTKFQDVHFNDDQALSEANSENTSKNPRRKSESVNGFFCKVCGASFRSSCNLQRHVDTIHNNVRRFKCNHCNSSFQQKPHLKVHIQLVHEKKKLFKCDKCDANFSTKSNLTKHIRNLHEKKLKLTNNGDHQMISENVMQTGLQMKL